MKRGITQSIYRYLPGAWSDYKSVTGKTYSGHLTWDASEPVQIVTLIGPMSKGDLTTMPYWTPDGETYYGLVLIPSKASGSTMFSGNALALHTMNDTPFTVSYSLVLTK